MKEREEQEVRTLQRAGTARELLQLPLIRDSDEKEQQQRPSSTSCSSRQLET